MVIPLKLGLVAADGADMPLRVGGKPMQGDVIALTRPSETIVFENVPERPVLSINREFSAPVKLTASLSADDLRRLAAHDSRSVQSLAGPADACDTAAGEECRADPGGQRC